jgi:hypothetical protein
MNEILINYIQYARNREYMPGVERDKLRIKQTSQKSFTPTLLVQEMLDKLEQEDPTSILGPNKYIFGQLLW